MKKLSIRITQEQRKGVHKLLEWCTYKSNSTITPRVSQMWYERKEFLEELQNKKSYDTLDRDMYNQIRQLYYIDKNYDKGN